MNVIGWHNACTSTFQASMQTYPNVILGDIAHLDYPPWLHSGDLDGVGGQQVADTTATEELLHSIRRSRQENLYV